MAAKSDYLKSVSQFRKLSTLPISCHGRKEKMRDLGIKLSCLVVHKDYGL